MAIVPFRTLEQVDAAQQCRLPSRSGRSHDDSPGVMASDTSRNTATGASACVARDLEERALLPRRQEIQLTPGAP